MKRSRFTDEQIIGILTEHEAGAKCADLCRKHGMSEGTFYTCKTKFGGMTVSEGRHFCAIGPSDNSDADPIPNLGPPKGRVFRLRSG